jgi:sirohydrochlorin ferrochelatase
VSDPPAVLLLDNGSKRPEATLHLRRLAVELSTRTGVTVQPVSLAHADQVDPARLGGIPAQTLLSACRDGWHRGITRYLVLPLFVGPSRALSREVPAQLARLHAEGLAIELQLLAPLAQPEDDAQLAMLLAEQLQPGLLAVTRRPTVILVDHGSPAPEVSAVRDRLARGLRAQLADRCLEVRVAAMERRAGSTYDFAGPLLAGLLDTLAADPQTCTAPVLLSLLFLSPGRHAGPDGDVAQIARASRLAPSIHISRPLGEHPALPRLLEGRLRAGLARWSERQQSVPAPRPPA